MNQAQRIITLCENASETFEDFYYGSDKNDSPPEKISKQEFHWLNNDVQDYFEKDGYTDIEITAVIEFNRNNKRMWHVMCQVGNPQTRKFQLIELHVDPRDKADRIAPAKHGVPAGGTTIYSEDEDGDLD